jgi:ketosteroid isomerase-like protein
MNQTHQSAEVPEVIRSYQSAHDRGDADTALGAFTADARVYDEDREYRGTGAIRNWVTDTSAKFTYTRTLTGVERLEDGTWLVQNRLEGDFPGGVVDLRYRFVLTGGRIADLAITP